MSHHALGAGPDGFVVHRNQRAGAVFGKEVAVDRADAGDHAVGGGAAAHFVVGHDSVAGREYERAELDPAAGIDEVGEAFALGAFALGVALLDPFAAILVFAESEDVEKLLEIGANVVEVDFLVGLLDRTADFGRFDERQGVAFVDDIALGHGELAQVAGDVGLDDMFHFHRVHNEQLLALAHGVALGDDDFDDGALQRGTDRFGVGRSDDIGERVCPGRDGGDGALSARAAALAEVVESGQGIAGIKLRAGQSDGVAGWLLGFRRRGEIGAMVVHPAGVDVSVCEVVVRERAVEEAEVGLNAVDAEFSERAARAGYGVDEVGGRRVGDQFGEQRVEVWVGGVAGVAVAGGRLVGGEHSAGGADLAVGLDSLHVDAGLDCVAARRGDIGLAEAEIGERLAGGDAQLGAHQIDADNFFGDGVLDLEARVGFDKREIALVVCVDEELKRGEAAIADGGGDADRRVGEARSGLGAEERAGRPFDDFLVAALEAALALAEMGDAARAVADDLHLDMSRAGQQAFDDDRRVAEGRGGFRLAAGVSLFDLVGGGHDAHAASAAAGDGLDHHRAVVERFEKGAGFAEADRSGTANQDGDAELFGERA